MSQENTSTIQISEAEAAPEQIQSGGFTSLIPMILIFVVFYFLLIRPQEKKRKAQEQLVSTAKVGENIVTHSGIYGKITKIDENDNAVFVEVSKNVEMKIMKTAIADILSRKTEEKKPATSKEGKTKSAAKSAAAKPVKKAVAKKTSTSAKKPAAKKPVKKGKK